MEEEEEEEEENICVCFSGAPTCSFQIFWVALGLVRAPSQRNPSLQDVVDTEQLGGDQVMEEKAREGYEAQRCVRLRRSWKLEPRKNLGTMSLHPGPALVTPLQASAVADGRRDSGAIRPSCLSLRPLIGSLAVFWQETTCPRDRHEASSWDYTSGEYLAADAARVAGLRSGRQMRGEENKKKERLEYR